MSSTQDVRFSAGAIEEGRKLANKLWNVSRLILANVGDARPELRPRDLEEHWIAERLDEAQAQLDAHLAEFEFSPATSVLYHLTFDDFCDWYAEAIKPRLYDGEKDAIATALATLGVVYSPEFLSSSEFETFLAWTAPLASSTPEQIGAVAEQWQADLDFDSLDRLGGVAAPLMFERTEDFLRTALTFLEGSSISSN